jgi:extradiol dioxygenase family protein
VIKEPKGEIMGASKFHISLNVQDLRGAAAFLELLLGTKPTQLHSNYAKFELIDPPLVLSLVPTELPTGSSINHLGFRLPTRESLDALRDRLQSAGVAHEIEESVACCHSRQSKFWVHDPSGNLWEFYVLEEPRECDAQMSDASKVTIASPQTKLDAIWGHRLGDPLPDRIPAEDGTLDKVVFEGTFNAQLSNGHAARILVEAARALRIGGTLVVHGLTADRPTTGPLALPGPAAKVSHVPTHRELIEAVEMAGFMAIELATFGETYSFNHAGTELRELKLHALRGGPAAAPSDHVAIYRGPFFEIRDESGRVFRRGEQTAIDEETYRRLRNSTSAAHFVFSLSDGQNAGPEHLVSIAANGDASNRRP